MKKIVSALGVSALGLGSSFLASPALAVTLADCGTAPTGGALTLSGSVCTLTFDDAGTYSFTTPDAVTDLQALLVGAGGGAQVDGSSGYAGSAGQVTYLPLGSNGVGQTFEINVGGGGVSSASNPTVGEGTTVSYNSGDTDVTAVGGAFANGFCTVSGSFSTYLGVGNGAGGNTTTTTGEACAAGPGVNPSLNAVDTDGAATPSLFTNYNVNLGKGGTVLDVPASLPALTAGSGASIIMDTANTNTTGHNATAGDGLVVFRWTIGGASESLANTGSDSSSILGLGAVAVAAGAALTVARRRPEGRHRA